VSEFIAIDFETANEKVASPCAVGWAVSRDGDIVDRGSFLIRPPEFRFNGINIAIHGIKPAMCETAPEWPDALDQLNTIIAGRLIAAHSASFDIAVIRHACDDTGTPRPELNFACTCRLARMVWPGQACYSLPDVADLAGVGEFEHHDASSDAWACAAIANRASVERQASGLPELLSQLGIIPGRLAPGLYDPAEYQPHRVPRELTPGTTVDPHHPFFGRKIAFTGGLDSMPRHDAQQAVMDVGGKPSTSVSKLTDFVVVGGEFHGLLKGHLSQKLELAIELRAAGASIELLSERDFLSVLLGGE
jgi:DNA polymerase-3 subunit epsilon